MTSAETTIHKTTVAWYATALQILDVVETFRMAKLRVETSRGIDIESHKGERLTRSAVIAQISERLSHLRDGKAASVEVDAGIKHPEEPTG